MKRSFFAFVVAVGLCFSASALTGQGDSAVGVLETISPAVTGITVLSESSIEISFSEALLTPGDTAPENYTISGVGAGTLAATPDLVTGSGPYTLTWFTGEMLGGETVTITVAGVQDLVGNPINPAQNSASDTGIGGLPEFTTLAVVPAQAAADTPVTITFTVSEPLDADPIVTVNGNAALWVTGGKAVDYTYEYTVQGSDTLGMATIAITGFDLAGNQGTLIDATALEIVSGEPAVPVHVWPVAALLLGIGVIVLLRRHRSAGVLLLVTALLLVGPAAFAQGPEVTNVTFTQGTDGAGGTQVDLYYDLVAPNGPCDITVLLSKDGGVNYDFTVTTISGDVTAVGTGTGYHIIWDVAADYPEEDIPNAAFRITADDGVVQYTLTYSAGTGGSISGDSPQTVNHGADGTEVIAVPDTGYHFVQWSDGVLTAARTDLNVTGNIAVSAEFVDTEITILLPGDVPLELMYIPAGTFMMGRYPGEQDSDITEDPQHSVTLSQGFYMGKYEITQQQWLAVMGSWPGTAPSASSGVGDTYPAYYVSWDDAQNFITALNTHITNTSQGAATVRLPSEAEWEYACRAGTTTRFYFGDSLGCAADCTDCAAGVMSGNRSDYMWYCGNNSPSGSKPVGGKLPNAFGLYDMSGNLYEWCEDDWHNSYTGAPANGSAWVDAPRGPYRLVRGGDWGNAAFRCRSARRLGDTPGFRIDSYGFRVVRTP